MPSRSLSPRLSGIPGVPPTTVTNGNTTTSQSTGTDTSAYMNESITLMSYLSARTDGTYTPKVTECDTLGGSYTDLAAADYVGGAVPAAQNAVGIAFVGIRNCKRYIKANMTQASGTSGGSFTIPIIFGHPRHGALPPV